MKLAAQYSTATAELVRAGQVGVDYFKSPAWEHIIPIAQEIMPTYVYFSLRVGWGIGDGEFN